VQQPILSHQFVTAEGAEPERWMFVLHGVFGMGTNFRAVAKALATRAPTWGFVLVDLRGHGASQGFKPAHDLEAAVTDLEALALHIDGRGIRGVMGHSFGGKIALAYLARHSLDVGCVLDSMPGARPRGAEADSAWRVLEALESIDRTYAARSEFQGELHTRGYPAEMIEWLTMNLRPYNDRYRLRLDLPAIRAMLIDYYARDLWAVLENPASAKALGLVIAGQASVFDEGSRERALRAAAVNPSLSVTVLENAGHWLHVDDPEGTVASMASVLERTL